MEKKAHGPLLRRMKHRNCDVYTKPKADLTAKSPRRVTMVTQSPPDPSTPHQVSDLNFLKCQFRFNLPYQIDVGDHAG